MARIGWHFPPLSGGQKTGFTNGNIQTFSGNKLRSLVREICQNSMDARIKNSQDPVIVKFKQVNIKRDKHQMFKQYSDRLNACRQLWGDHADPRLSEFLNNAEKMLEEKEIPSLIVSDYNTQGLTNINQEYDSKWNALVRTDGLSFQESKTSGGSFGVGKNAPFAFSTLSMVFYNTLNHNGESAFEGVARVASLEIDGKKTQGIGHYRHLDPSNKDTDQYSPILPEDKSSIRDIFQRKQQGTDVIIIGCSIKKNWELDVKAAVLKDFMLAVHERNLEIYIEDEKINADTIGPILQQLSETNPNDKNIKRTLEFYEILTSANKDHHKFMGSIREENDLELHIVFNNNYSRKIAKYRSIGMLIEEKGLSISRHCSAILVARKEELNTYLRLAEPIDHTKWSHTNIENSDDRKTVKEILDQMVAFVDEKLKELDNKNVQDSFDSEEGEYLPLDHEGAYKGNIEDDLRKNQKIERIRTDNQINEALMKKDARSTKGKKKKGTIEGNGGRGNGKKPVVDGSGNLPGASKGKGTKIISTPSLLKKRIFPINSDIGLYQATILPEQANDNIYIEFQSIGENGKTENISLKQFSIKEKKESVTGNKIGPIIFADSSLHKIIFTLDKKEKVDLNIVVTREVTK